MFASDLVRGIVATDALIGTFAGLDDPGLVQNRCFLYHVIGNGTGRWDVPVGGMGAWSRRSRGSARAGAELQPGGGYEDRADGRGTRRLDRATAYLPLTSVSGQRRRRFWPACSGPTLPRRRPRARS